MAIKEHSIFGFLLALSLYLSLSIGGIGLGGEYAVERILIVFFLLVVFVFFLPRVDAIRLDSFFIFFAITFFILVQVAMSSGSDIVYKKIDGFLLGGFFVFYFSRLGKKAFGKEFFEYFVFVGLLTLGATFIYKVIFGFSDREVRFFINGPIVFGWLMSVMVLICIYIGLVEKKKSFLFCSVIFLISVIWSGSKGPVLALVFSVPLMFFLLGRLGKFAMLFFGAIFLIFLASEFDLVPDRFDVFYRIISNELNDNDFGSIGIRQMMFLESIEVFKGAPIFGVGIGNWSQSFQGVSLWNYGFYYPHNFFVEVLSEFGLFGAAFFLCCLTLIFFNLGVLGKSIFIFSLVALNFSGDMAYWRFLFFLPFGLDFKDLRGNA